MIPSSDDARLSRIKTHWTQLLATGDARAGSVHQLLVRYYGAAYRYLLGMVRDAAAAEDLCQEFAVRFLRGDFQHADPQRGRFRDFLKTALRNQVRDHWRKANRRPDAAALPDGLADDPPEMSESENLFLAGWREELLARTWAALAEYEQSTGKPYCAVLQLKTQEPQLRSPEIADRLARERGRDCTPEAARQLLHRAREQFADLLLDEVQVSMPSPDLDRLEDELQELQLLGYCRLALERRQRRG